MSELLILFGAAFFAGYYITKQRQPVDIPGRGTWYPNKLALQTNSLAFNRDQIVNYPNRYFYQGISDLLYNGKNPTPEQAGSDAMYSFYVKGIDPVRDAKGFIDPAAIGNPGTIPMQMNIRPIKPLR